MLGSTSQRIYSRRCNGLKGAVMIEAICRLNIMIISQLDS